MQKKNLSLLYTLYHYVHTLSKILIFFNIFEIKQKYERQQNFRIDVH